MTTSRPLFFLAFSISALVSSAAPAALFDATNQRWEAVRGSAEMDARFVRGGSSTPSVRIEPNGPSDAWVRSAPVQLTIGRQYELSSWIRTEALEAQDTNRTPIAVGAALQMASMPHDVHSESIGGSRDWTRVTLRFTATRAQDSIVLTAANGGRMKGKAWFSGISLDEAASSAAGPNRKSVKTFGPAYRYPSGGWIYLHIEGEPYERGYQHGYLLSKEIVSYMERGNAELGNKSKRDWERSRTVANALFLRGFDDEILQEMKGIAEGASAAGAKWDDRPVDLVDIVTANTVTELDLVRAALTLTPTGLEGLSFKAPAYANGGGGGSTVPVNERCSAFAATGKATRDGKMVIGHITWWPLTLAEQTNVMLDVKPTKGHRLMMQAYPGGIQSGTDWYQNDVGVVLTETTIRQSPFNMAGTPVAYRARRAIQYGDDIDHVVKELETRNNGLYTNEWIIGDARSNEIAMYELGTNKTRLYRSSKNDWFNGTEGFYWGCNNAKDLSVRLEYAPDSNGAPQNIPFVPAPRDIKWQEMYRQYKGSIDEQFGFLAFRTPPLNSASAMDVKLATSDMAARMMAWTVFGLPNERERKPTERDKKVFAGNQGLYSSGYRVISAYSTEALAETVLENERLRKSSHATPSRESKTAGRAAPSLPADGLWRGWMLPASDADLWLTRGSVAYMDALNSADFDRRMEEYRTGYRLASLDGDPPLGRLRADATSREWAEIASTKGALCLDALRLEMGDKPFFSFMKSWSLANTTKAVKADEFLAAAGRAAGEPLTAFRQKWIDSPGLPKDAATEGSATFLADSILSRLGSALIVYGTTTDAGANRFAAETLQRAWNGHFESMVPIRRDFEVSPAELASHDVVFVGRPETNSALRAWQTQLGLTWDQTVFTAGGAEYASEYDGLAYAARNPANDHRMALVLAGNSALETVRVASASLPNAAYQVYESGSARGSGFAIGHQHQ